MRARKKICSWVSQSGWKAEGIEEEKTMASVASSATTGGARKHAWTKKVGEKTTGGARKPPGPKNIGLDSNYIQMIGDKLSPATGEGDRKGWYIISWNSMYYRIGGCLPFYCGFNRDLHCFTCGNRTDQHYTMRGCGGSEPTLLKILQGLRVAQVAVIKCWQ